jgi:hypothetical protein
VRDATYNVRISLVGHQFHSIVTVNHDLDVQAIEHVFGQVVGRPDDHLVDILLAAVHQAASHTQQLRLVLVGWC